jgi:hypothetical protein
MINVKCNWCSQRIAGKAYRHANRFFCSSEHVTVFTGVVSATCAYLGRPKPAWSDHDGSQTETVLLSV